MTPPYDTFISYRRADRPMAEALGQLVELQGRRAFLDVNNIQPAERWQAEIDRALAQISSLQGSQK